MVSGYATATSGHQGRVTGDVILKTNVITVDVSISTAFIRVLFAKPEVVLIFTTAAMEKEI